jgi:uncharacterized protein GlcG (DUF336 family)
MAMSPTPAAPAPSAGRGSVKGSVEITIDRSGGVSFQVKGVKGASCLDLTDALEKALGTVVSRERTGEYYETAQVQATVQTQETGQRTVQVKRGPTGQPPADR